MNKSIIIAALIAALGGCRSVKVENHGQDYVRDGSGGAVLVDGRPIVISRGWTVGHFQHWMLTRADTMTASVAPDLISFALNGLNTSPDSNGLAKLVDASLTGSANLAAKIGAAIATAGGSVGADAIAGYVRQFISQGGDPSKATVTVSDGKVSCTDGSCSIVGDCAE